MHFKNILESARSVPQLIAVQYVSFQSILVVPCDILDFESI